jgi:hypothetical protein
VSSLAKAGDPVRRDDRGLTVRRGVLDAPPSRGMTDSKL